MNKQVIIIGAGGHGKVVADIIEKSGDKVYGFLDDNLTAKEFCGFPVLGSVCEYKKYADNAQFVIAIGNADVRHDITQKLGKAKIYTAIHPAAVISEIATAVGEGTVIMANAVVNPSAHIGKHCIINTSAVVEHDNYIGDFSHISVGAKLGGTVAIGAHTWVGIGATVSNNVTVCDHCVIGAGAVVIHNIKESGTYVGVPARKIK